MVEEHELRRHLFFVVESSDALFREEVSLVYPDAPHVTKNDDYMYVRQGHSQKIVIKGAK